MQENIFQTFTLSLNIYLVIYSVSKALAKCRAGGLFNNVINLVTLDVIKVN